MAYFGPTAILTRLADRCADPISGTVQVARAGIPAYTACGGMKYGQVALGEQSVGQGPDRAGSPRDRGRLAGAAGPGGPANGEDSQRADRPGAHTRQAAPGG